MPNLARLVPSTISWLSHRLQGGVDTARSNPYLEGAFAPVQDERTETSLRVTGRIPRDLEGIFTRIGPNPVRTPNPGSYHWFAGDGMVHGLRLHQGMAQWYRNRWVGADETNKALRRPLLGGPRHGVFDVVNTNVVSHAGRIWATNEGGAMPAELDEEMNTVGRSFLSSDLSRAFTAHPRQDPQTGELHAICYDGGPHRYADHVVITKQGDVSRVQRIPLKHAPMIHDCAITARHVLVLDLPVSFSFGAFLRGAAMPYRWNPGHEARVGLLPRQGGEASDIIWCSVAPCFVYHVANAYETDDGRVVLQAVVHDKVFDKQVERAAERSVTFEEWIIDPDSRSVSRRTLSDESQEFPRIDESLTGRRHRYVYTVGFKIGGAEGQSVFRYDMTTGHRERHEFGAARIPGEAVFVKREGAVDEAEGWLLTYVHDGNTGASDLVILDAANLDDDPIATVHLPWRVPMGFHSTWIDRRLS